MNILLKSLSSERMNTNTPNEEILSSSSEEEIKIKPKKTPKLCKLYNDNSSVSIVSNFSSCDIKFSRGSFRFCMSDNEILLVFHPMFLWKLLHAKKIWVDCQRDFCRTRTNLSMLINNTSSVTFRLNEQTISYYIDNRIKTHKMNESYDSLTILFYKLNRSIQNQFSRFFFFFCFVLWASCFALLSSCFVLQSSCFVYFFFLSYFVGHQKGALEKQVKKKYMSN